MKAYRLAFLLTLAILAESVFARPARAIAVGVILGEPTGISLQWIRPGNRAVNASIAWSFRGRDTVHATIDYVIRRRFDNRDPLDFYYYGIGAGIGLAEAASPENAVDFNLRVPLGIEAFPADRVGGFFEIAPGVEMIPSTDFELSGGVGVRYHF